MNLSDPKPKKFCRLQQSQPLPLIKNSDGNYQFKGEFNGYSIIIRDHDDMKNMISMGSFGKACLSRNYPIFQQKTQILRKRVHDNRKKLTKTTDKPETLIVVPDSNDDDDDIDDYFTNLQPRYEFDYSKMREFVCLNLEEAFFLCSVMNCLEIYDKNVKLTVAKLWLMFQQIDRYFLQNYIAYYYFRTKNWVVKPGIKFGGDFLLYKQGPPFYHASYVVIIQIVDSNWENLEELTRRSMDAINLTSLNRLCETAGKELLVCQIHWPDTVNYQDLSNIQIQEILMKRWLSNQERQFDET